MLLTMYQWLADGCPFNTPFTLRRIEHIPNTLKGKEQALYLACSAIVQAMEFHTKEIGGDRFVIMPHSDYREHLYTFRNFPMYIEMTTDVSLVVDAIGIIPKDSV